MVDPISAIQLAHNNLLAYCILQMDNYEAVGHHQLIARALQRVEAGKCKRLIVSMPPRHGKSLLCSQFFPAWYLGRNPDKYIITSTYAQELAEDWGRKIRDQLKDQVHKVVFPGCRLRDDSAAANRLMTEKGGAYFAVGAGGAITGRGAHLLLIDDPIKGREEADSDTMRKKIKDWYTSVAYTRLMPEGAVVIIQTRWHEDDLAGWLLSEHKHEDWEVLSLPAINREDGAALWPNAYPIETLRRIQKAIGPRDWSALYMQEPVPDTGEYFREDWFKTYDIVPDGLRIYGVSDYAVTPDGGDYTEHGIFGIDAEKNIFVLDWWSGRTQANVWIDIQIDYMAEYEPVGWIGEMGAIKRAIEPFLMDRMNERGVYCNMQWMSSITAKEIRLRGFQAMAAMGKVYFPRKLWADEVKSQLLRFPAGKHDDKVDVCGLVARAIEGITPGDYSLSGYSQKGLKERYRPTRSRRISWMGR